MTLYQYQIDTFKKIDPAKKFSAFTYYDLPDFAAVNSGDCTKGSVIKINGSYFLYSGMQLFTTSLQANQISRIQFKDGRNVLATINS